MAVAVQQFGTAVLAIQCSNVFKNINGQKDIKQKKKIEQNPVHRWSYREAEKKIGGTRKIGEKLA